MLFLRLIMHLKNEAINARSEAALLKRKTEGVTLTKSRDGRAMFVGETQTPSTTEDTSRPTVAPEQSPQGRHSPVDSADVGKTLGGRQHETGFQGNI